MDAGGSGEGVGGPRSLDQLGCLGCLVACLGRWRRSLTQRDLERRMISIRYLHIDNESRAGRKSIADHGIYSRAILIVNNNYRPLVTASRRLWEGGRGGN